MIRISVASRRPITNHQLTIPKQISLKACPSHCNGEGQTVETKVQQGRKKKKSYAQLLQRGELRRDVAGKVVVVYRKYSGTKGTPSTRNSSNKVLNTPWYDSVFAFFFCKLICNAHRHTRNIVNFNISASPVKTTPK